MTSLRAAVHDKEILVVCGSGGVGKTSVSAALAVQAAATRKTIVLTIDPARRLASALGLQGAIGHEVTEVDIGSPGSLYAAMLDMKTAWDEVVARSAPNEQVAQSIRSNPLYQGLSEHFVGSHSYMAMQRLAELHASGDYECIVIDTPPTRRALDFLEAPKRMTDFVGGSLLRWFAKPYTAAGKLGLRAFNLTASPVLKVADRVLGSQVLEELAAFVLDFQTLYDDFKRRAAGVLELLHDRRTGFVVVTTLEGPPLREALFFLDRLADERLAVAGTVANKVVPKPFAGAQDTLDALDRADLPELARAGGLEPGPAAEVLAASREDLRTLVAAARRDAERMQALSRRTRVPITTVPLMAGDIHNVATLRRLGRHLTAGRPSR